MTSVVNIRKEECDVYIGRGSIFGNPFKIGQDGTREEVIDKYMDYFYKKLEEPNFRKAIEDLKGKKLGCYCHPEKCHGDIIKQYLEIKYKIEPIFGREENILEIVDKDILINSHSHNWPPEGSEPDYTKETKERLEKRKKELLQETIPQVYHK